MGEWENVLERKMMHEVSTMLIREGVEVDVYESNRGFEYYILLDKGVLGHLWIGARDKDFVRDFDKGQYYESGYGLKRMYWYYEDKRKISYIDNNDELDELDEVVEGIIKERENVKEDIEQDYNEYVKKQNIEDLEEDVWKYAKPYQAEDEGVWESKIKK